MAQLAARRSHNPKVASSILAGSIAFFIFLEYNFFCVVAAISRELDFVRVARLSVGWPSGPRR